MSSYTVLSSLTGPPTSAVDYKIITPASVFEEIRPTPNLKFKPLPSTSGYCSKLKLTLIFDSNMFIGGQTIKGNMELVSLTDSALMLGEIALHFTAYEEISGKSFHQSSALYSSRLQVQGPKLPPSEAVHGAPTKDGYYSATKRKTIFPFSFDLPRDAPSSFTFNSREARLRYIVTGSVEFKYGAQKDVLFKSKDVKVLEQWNLIREKTLAASIERSNSRKLFLGGDGEVHMTVSLEKDFLIAGSNVQVMIKVKNETRKRVQGFRISFVKRLMVATIDEEDRNIKITDENHHSVMFREECYEPLDERSSVVHITVPIDAQTIRNTNLAELHWKLVVALHIPGILSKDLSVDVPVKICHSNSLTHCVKEPIELPFSEKGSISKEDTSQKTNIMESIPIPPIRSSMKRVLPEHPPSNLIVEDMEVDEENRILDLSGIGYILEKAFQLWDSAPSPIGINSSSSSKRENTQQFFKDHDDSRELAYLASVESKAFKEENLDASGKKKRSIRRPRPLPLPILPPTLPISSLQHKYFDESYDFEKTCTYRSRKELFARLI